VPPKAPPSCFRLIFVTKRVFFLKISKCLSPPANPIPRVTSRPPSVTFWPQEAKSWASRGYVRSSKVPLNPPKARIIIRLCRSWYPSCGIHAPRKPKLGLFFQNNPPTRSCKDNEYALQLSQFKYIMISKSNQ